MKSLDINLNSIDKVKSFVNVVSTYDGDLDLSSDRYTINAKSIMGIFSLDLSKPITLKIYNDSDLEKIEEKLKDFII